MAIILSADRTCDLSAELIKEYDVHTMPYHILVDNVEHIDGVDVTPEEIYQVYYDKKILPKTSAVNIGEYIEYFTPFVEAGHQVVHFNLGSKLSSSHQNCVNAAATMEGVTVIDGRNLSAGVGLQILDAGEMIKAGKTPEEIKAYFDENHQCYHGSFVVDDLEFLKAGGRCSALTAFSAGLLNIHPCIEVDNTCGGMGVGKKYRGSFEKVMAKYIKEKLAQYDDIRTDRVFLTDSGGLDDAFRDKMEQVILECVPFEKVYRTTASCTISSHCGPKTMGILFATEKPSK
ncbi:MAG: DegV family protein [Firmicutes bacterium]|nr:DegV family protein [Bacillota bacterium]